jgi:Flp pilus assembly protein TadD
MSEPSIEFYNAAIDAVQAGRLPEALTAAENSLTEDPTDSQTWQLYVVILNALGRTEDAQKASAKLETMGIDEVDSLLIKA